MRIHELTVETVAGISGHALSGQRWEELRLW
nr:MAG TPA: hypothetical protein [Caudoviricetes sp.]DAG22670.1 MAG TPA: hypothetical protein [Caudoviricetes sp.]DAH40648.1 MAG TPA: hypothetical protein [Caudoviricetes sp.]DAO08437.1 MAG TPA: hypothetical protein [Caudoviricetes sp.]